MDLTPAELAQFDRTQAAVREYVVARFNLDVAADECGGAFENLADAWSASEAAEIAAHPDLSEVNAQLDGYYGE